MSSMINDLTSKPFENFVMFCECLMDTNQLHVIRDLLTPIGVGERILQTEEIQHPTDDLGIKWRSEVGQVVIESHEGEQVGEQSTTHQLEKRQETVDFDWRNAIKVNLPKLAVEIEPNGDLLNELVGQGVVSETWAETFSVGIKISSSSDDILCNCFAELKNKHFVAMMSDLSAVEVDQLVLKTVFTNWNFCYYIAAAA